VSAAEADVQLFWGEPLAGVAERIDRLRALSESLAREHAPLEFGLRITTLVRDTTEEAWRDAEAKVATMSEEGWRPRTDRHQSRAVGKQEIARVGDQLLSRPREPAAV
jgi:alkanesulfonate monooxygenase